MRAALLALVLSVTTAAADPARLAEDAARRMDAAAEALGRDGDRVAALTRALEAYQSGEAILREALRQADVERTRVEAALAEGDAALSSSAALLIRLQTRPRETLTLHPGGPLSALRAGRLAAVAVEETGRQTAGLARARDDLADVMTLRADLLDRFHAAGEDIRTTRRALLAESEARAPEVPATDAAILSALLDASDSLGALADAFTESPSAAPELVDLPLPAPGEAEVSGEGLALMPLPGAILRAPARATIRYAGPAPAAPGQTALLIEPAPGHLLILSGPADLLVAPGQIVSAGEPIALMRPSVAPDPAQDDPNVNETPPPSGQPPRERLYIEWREGGAPTDISGRFILP